MDAGKCRRTSFSLILRPFTNPRRSAQAWAPIVLSVFTIIATSGSLLFLSLRIILLVRRNSRNSRETILAAGGGPYTPLWNAYKPSRWWFFFPSLSAVFVRAMFIAFARVRPSLSMRSASVFGT